jgi:hypothetical protein
MILWRVAGGLGVAGLAAAVLVIAYLAIALAPFPLGFLVPIGVAAALAFTFLAFAQPYVAILMTFFVLPFEYLTVLFPADSYGSGGILNFITLVKLMFGCVIVAGFLRLSGDQDERPLRNLWRRRFPCCCCSSRHVLDEPRQREATGRLRHHMISIGSGVWRSSSDQPSDHRSVCTC